MPTATIARRPPLLLFALLTAVAILAGACSGVIGTDVDVAAGDDLGDTGPPGELGEVLAELRDGGFNGVALIATPDDTDIVGMGLADRERGIGFGPETVVDIGSITKQFTGAAILRLQMDGELSVDDTLATFFPDLPVGKGELTLHQLLTHTAGLPPAIGHDYDPIERDGYLDLVAETPFDHPPGTAYQYSNVGYSLLAAVIETVTGGTYEAYLRAALFEPAGMAATGYVLPDWAEHEVAVGYDGDEVFGRPHEQTWADDGPYWHLRGNGGLLSTVLDLHRWHEALLDDDILDGQAKELYYGRHTPEGEGADTYYGYGWTIFPTPADSLLITHNGGNGIFFADFLRFVDDGVTVILATNSVRPPDEDAAYRIAGAAIDLGFEVSGGCQPAVALDDLDRIDQFPATPPGETTAELVAVLTEPDDPARTEAFVDQRLAEALTGGATTEEVLAEVAAIQEEFAGMTVTGRHREDERTFHVQLEGGASGQRLLSVRMDDGDPARLTCVEILD